MGDQGVWDIYGEPSVRVQNKKRQIPNRWLEDYIRATTLIFVGTSDDHGNQYLSPRGGPPGFLQLVGKALYFPEISGNKLFESVRSAEKNPVIGLLLIVPGMDELVRIQGTCKILREIPSGLEINFSFSGNLSQTYNLSGLYWEVVISSWYYHCGRAIRHSGIFDQEVVASNAKNNQLLASYAKQSDEY